MGQLEFMLHDVHIMFKSMILDIESKAGVYEKEVGH